MTAPDPIPTPAPETGRTCEPAGAVADAERATQTLLDRMASRRPVLLAVLRACAQPRPVEEVEALVDDLQANDCSVYSAASLCLLLERAGALQLVDADGTPFAEVSAEPQVVVVDGVEYLEPRPVPARYWRTTDAGCVVAGADDPASRLSSLLEEEPAYAPIYERVLTLCARDGGVPVAELAEAVDRDPAVQEPRRYVQFFLERLKDRGALSWDGSWHITDCGLALLDTLATA